jgi:hypothetical protein
MTGFHPERKWRIPAISLASGASPVEKYPLKNAMIHKYKGECEPSQDYCQEEDI